MFYMNPRINADIFIWDRLCLGLIIGLEGKWQPANLLRSPQRGTCPFKGPILRSLIVLNSM